MCPLLCLCGVLYLFKVTKKSCLVGVERNQFALVVASELLIPFTIDANSTRLSILRVLVPLRGVAGAPRRGSPVHLAGGRRGGFKHNRRNTQPSNPRTSQTPRCQSKQLTLAMRTRRDSYQIQRQRRTTDKLARRHLALFEVSLQAV